MSMFALRPWSDPSAGAAELPQLPVASAPVTTGVLANALVATVLGPVTPAPVAAPDLAPKQAHPASVAPPARHPSRASHTSAPAQRSSAPAQPARTTSTVHRPKAAAHTAPPATTGYGCSAALAYLAAHAAPGFRFECPGYSYGHQAMTCVDVAPQCPGTQVIAITVPCPAAYKNEASNSWVLLGKSNAPIDPYGYCH